MHNFDCFIFDLDGTLLDSSHQVIRCMRRAFESCGVSADESKLNSNLIGPPLREIVEMIAPDIKEEKIILDIIKNFREIYETDRDETSALYEGVFEFLTELKLAGKKIFMATFKPEKPTLRLAREFKLDMFDDFYTVDKFGSYTPKEEMIADILEKHGLQKSKTVMVGDALNDVLAAKKAGVIAVGVLWGYGACKEPLEQAADCVIGHIGELKYLKSKLKA